MTKTGGDYFTLAEIRTMLREANDAFDGPGGVTLYCLKHGPPRLTCADGETFDPIVNLPGDGRPFPDRAFAEALRVAPVIVECE